MSNDSQNNGGGGNGIIVVVLLILGLAIFWAFTRNVFMW